MLFFNVSMLFPWFLYQIRYNDRHGLFHEHTYALNYITIWLGHNITVSCSSNFFLPLLVTKMGFAVQTHREIILSCQWYLLFTMLFIARINSKGLLWHAKVPLILATPLRVILCISAPHTPLITSPDIRSPWKVLKVFFYIYIPKSRKIYSKKYKIMQLA